MTIRTAKMALSDSATIADGKTGKDEQRLVVKARTMAEHAPAPTTGFGLRNSDSLTACEGSTGSGMILVSLFLSYRSIVINRKGLPAGAEFSLASFLED